MPRKDPRIRVDRGLYRAGDVFYACATPLGSRGGLEDARSRRPDGGAPGRRRVTYAEVAAEWLVDQEASDRWRRSRRTTSCAGAAACSGLSTWSIRHAWAPHRRAAGGGDRSVRLPIATAVFSGLRLGELLGLTWEDTDFKGGALKVHFQMTRQGERRP